MSFLKNMLGIREIKESIFLKDFNEDNEQLSDLINLSAAIKSEKKDIIDRDIFFLRAGIYGERNVYYELKHSFLPMICLHDIRIEDGDYVAQLDFVVITANFIMILETKRLNGDIFINEAGDFIRYIKNKQGKNIRKEGIYSPIAQNDRHVRIVKNMLLQNGVIRKLPVISGVVIANEKSIVNKSRAPFKIKHEIFRFDQLTDVIKKKMDFYKKDNCIFDNTMREIADFFISRDTRITYDYAKKYALVAEDYFCLDDEEGTSVIEEVAISNDSVVEEVVAVTEAEYVIEQEVEAQGISREELYNRLKVYRLNKARELQSKPYFIFNNETLDGILDLMPNSKEELIRVKGFGAKKVEMFGEDIIKIITIVE